MKNSHILKILNFLILQAHYSLDNFLIEYRQLPHETLNQDVSSHEIWARLWAKNEIGQISSESENVVILLLRGKILISVVSYFWAVKNQFLFFIDVSSCHHWFWYLSACVVLDLGGRPVPLAISIIPRPLKIHWAY